MIYIILLLLGSAHLFGIGDDDPTLELVQSKERLKKELTVAIFGSDSDSDTEEPPAKKQKLEEEEDPNPEEGTSLNQFIDTVRTALRNQDPSVPPLYSTARNVRSTFTDATDENNFKLILFCSFYKMSPTTILRKDFYKKLGKSILSALKLEPYETGLTGAVADYKAEGWVTDMQKYATALKAVLGVSESLNEGKYALVVVENVLKAFLKDLLNDKNEFFYIANSDDWKKKLQEYQTRTKNQPIKKHIEAIGLHFLQIKILRRQSSEAKIDAVETEETEEDKKQSIYPSGVSCNPNELQGRQQEPDDDDTEEEDESFFRGNNPRTSSHSESTTPSQTASTTSNTKKKPLPQIECESSRRSVFDPHLFNRLLNIEEEEDEEEAEEVVEEGNPLFEPRIEDRILERELNHIVDTAKAQENEESFLQSAGIWAYYILGQALIHVERFVLTAAPLLISYNQKVSTIK